MSDQPGYLPVSLVCLCAAQFAGTGKLWNRSSPARRKKTSSCFIAGTSTFGGRKGLGEIETAFNKRFGTKMKINFAAGPDMNARAARHITEIKSGRKASSDIFLGSQSHQALMHKENALEKVNYAGIFSWVSKEMEIFPGETVLTYTSPNGIVYNKT